MSIVNISTKEKTLKSMYQLIDSDNYTLDKFLLYCKYNRSDLQLVIGNILDDYRDYFEQFLEEITIPKEFFYQPASFAENYYGSADLDFLILYFAKINTLFDFKKETIKVLPASHLMEINRLIVEYKGKIKESYNHPTQYMEETYLRVY